MEFTDDKLRALLANPANHPPSARHLGFELIDFSGQTYALRDDDTPHLTPAAYRAWAWEIWREVKLRMDPSPQPQAEQTVETQD